MNFILGSDPLPRFPYNELCDFNKDTCGFKNGGSAVWNWKKTNNTGSLFAFLLLINTTLCNETIIRVFCPRVGPKLQAQEPWLQFCRRHVFHCKLRNQGCSFIICSFIIFFKLQLFILVSYQYIRRRGVVDRVPAFQPSAPGSIPGGDRNFNFCPGIGCVLSLCSVQCCLRRRPWHCADHTFREARPCVSV